MHNPIPFCDSSLFILVEFIYYDYSATIETITFYCFIGLCTVMINFVVKLKNIKNAGLLVIKIHALYFIAKMKIIFILK